MLTTDHPCAAPGDGAETGEQPGKRPSRSATETGSERPERETEGEKDRTERATSPDPALARPNSSNSPATAAAAAAAFTSPNTIMKERIWPNRVANKIVHQPLNHATGASLRNEHAMAVPGEPTLHLEFYRRGVSNGEARDGNWRVMCL